ncbi:MAG TPA: cellulose synthase subunit BcsC-related outer membrane protein [Hyphomonas sp.]|nr:cellulose synthase subunit BcsC-related outer membrane protein [Hyphomonas sp.]HRX73935.1 cellulose synthase subunit BcsC-related outer membrane protein [Hyphomonas sp.]
MRTATPLLRAAVASAALMLFPGVIAGAAPDTGGEVVKSIGIPGADKGAGTDVAASAGAEPIEARTPPAVPPEADVQAVWALGASGKWTAAEARLQALRERFQGWDVPGDLTTYVAAGRRDEKVRTALAKEDWPGVLALLPPAGADACEPAFQLWARADALDGTGDEAGLRAFYVRVLSNCRDAGTTAALVQRAISRLDTDGLAEVAAIPALSNNHDPRVAGAYSELLREAAWQRFTLAEAAGDMSTAGAIADESQDPRLLSQAGWMFLSKDADRSAAYFSAALAAGAGEEAHKGLIRAALANGDFPAARSAIAAAPMMPDRANLSALADLGEAQLARESGDWQRAVELASRAAGLDPDLEPEAQTVAGGALLDAATLAYDRNEFSDARALALRAAAYPSVRRAAEMRAAWAALQAGDAEGASAGFRALYLAKPDDESAEGFALASQKAGTLGSAAAIARAAGGPLGGKVQAQYAAVAFYDGDYLTARARAPDAYEALEGIDHTVYRQTISMRQQDGARGQNRLTGYAATTSAEIVRGVDRYEVGLTLYRLDTGEAGGAGQETYAAPYMSFSREGTTSLAARIGLLPVGGGAPATLTGEIAAARDFGKHHGEAHAFVRPKTDSLLALAGAANASGTETGRVREAGLLVRGRADIGGGRAIQVEMGLSRLEGREVVRNDMISGGISANQSIKKDGFDYLVTGPFYQFQSYDRNTNFFTTGHGGYFSPQEFHRAGWSINARTKPLNDWLVKADAAVAYETVREDAASEYPLNADQGMRIGGGDSSGVAGAIDIALARRIGPEVIISANLSATASKAFEDLRAGIGIAWVPGGRAGLVPTDLTTDPFSPASWIRP